MGDSRERAETPPRMKERLIRSLLGRALPFYRRTLGRLVNSLFQMDLLAQTHTFTNAKWLEWPIMQSVMDLWTIQETIAEVRPALLIETGTNRGGSALFYAHLFDLMGHGHVITVDVNRAHDLSHHRITFLTGSSVSAEILEQIEEAVDRATGPVMVILDSDHSEAHVSAELDAYSEFVSPGSFILVQDGVIDTLPIGRPYRPGPLPAIQAFLRRNAQFQPDLERCARFVITQHPMGWLRRTG